MERLTFDNNGVPQFTREGMTMYCSSMAMADCVYELENRLAAYEEAEEQGLLVRLPCKVGDTVYCLWYEPCHLGNDHPDSYDCDGCEDECDLKKAVVERVAFNVEWIVHNMMGKMRVAYATREEAEAALKED